jgi:hypothetical protein
MIELERCRSTFGELAFWFSDSKVSAKEGRLIGFAPQGRVGVVEFQELGETTRTSLLVSASVDHKAECWAALCVATLAAMLRVEFCSWLAAQMRTRGLVQSWSIAETFGTATVSAAFFPIDIVLITVETPRAVQTRSARKGDTCGFARRSRSRQ